MLDVCFDIVYRLMFFVTQKAQKCCSGFMHPSMILLALFLLSSTSRVKKVSKIARKTGMAHTDFNISFDGLRINASHRFHGFHRFIEPWLND